MIPSGDEKRSIDATTYINSLGEIVVGERPDRGSVLETCFRYYLTFSHMVAGGVRQVAAFFRKAVENAENYTHERVDALCVATPIIFDDKDCDTLILAAESLSLPIELVRIGDLMAYFYGCKDRQEHEPKQFAILHNDSQYAEFGIYGLQKQKIVRYMLKEIPSPLYHLTRYIEGKINERLDEGNDIEAVFYGSDPFLAAQNIVEHARKKEFPMTIDLSEVDPNIHETVTVQWDDICNMYRQLFVDAMSEEEALPQALKGNTIPVLNGGFTYDWNILRNAYEDCGLFDDVIYSCNTEDLAKAACAFLTMKQGIADPSAEYPVPEERLKYRKYAFLDAAEIRIFEEETEDSPVTTITNQDMISRLSIDTPDILALFLEELVRSGARDMDSIKSWLKTEVALDDETRIMFSEFNEPEGRE